VRALWGVHPICDFRESKYFLRGIRFRSVRLIQRLRDLVSAFIQPAMDCFGIEK